MAIAVERLLYRAIGAPEVGLKIHAMAALSNAVLKGTPTSFTGGVSAATVMQHLATSIGLQFENNGVTAMIPSV
jgi:hypothetical protein